MVLHRECMSCTQLLHAQAKLQSNQRWSISHLWPFVGYACLNQVAELEQRLHFLEECIGVDEEKTGKSLADSVSALERQVSHSHYILATPLLVSDLVSFAGGDLGHRTDGRS